MNISVYAVFRFYGQVQQSAGKCCLMTESCHCSVIMKVRARPVRNNGKRVWCVDLRCVGRGRLFYTDKLEADREAAVRQRELENHGARAFDLSDEERTMFLAAKERLATMGATIDTAVDFFVKHGPVRENQTLKDAVDKLIANRRQNGKRERYLIQLRSTLGQFVEGRDQKNCADVTKAEIDEWINANGWAPKTRYGKLTDVQTLFAFAQRNGWCVVSPCPSRDEITLDDKPPGILTVEQCKALLQTAHKKEPTLIAYIALGLFAGIRPEELIKLDWTEIDLKKKLVEVKAEKAKTRKRRLVNLSENCVKWLKLGGELPPVNFKKKFDRVREAAKIADWPHDGMRHSFASYHLAMHGSADKTAVQMGHRSTEMLFSHYRELIKDPKQAKEFWSIRPENATK